MFFAGNATELGFVYLSALQDLLEENLGFWPAEADENLVECRRRALAVEFNPVEAVVEIEQVAIDLPAAFANAV